MGKNDATGQKIKTFFFINFRLMRLGSCLFNVERRMNYPLVIKTQKSELCGLRSFLCNYGQLILGMLYVVIAK